MIYYMYNYLSWGVTIFWIIVWLLSIIYVQKTNKKINKKPMLIIPLVINCFKLFVVIKLSAKDPIDYHIDLLDTKYIDFNKKIFPKNFKDAFVGLLSVTLFQLLMVFLFFYNNLS
jgi:hypothetical protein